MWFDALRADAVFGWRQLRKHPVASAAAILSLGLSIGACAAAFRIVDALLLRPLPVAAPDELYTLRRAPGGVDGASREYDGFEYPLFAQIRAAVKGDAELLAVSYAARSDVTYGPDQDMERAHLQFVSGWMFESFGLRPSLGRLLSEADERTPGAHPYAVLSHDYWTRRFGQDPHVIGRTVRIRDVLYEIVGVGPAGFTGVEPGTVTSIFIPTSMHPGVQRDDWSWFRAMVRVRSGAAIDPLRAKMQGVLRAFQEHRARTFTDTPQQRLTEFINEQLSMEPAAAGVSSLQRETRRPLIALSILVVLVLLIACANVANLMTARAASRAREMALRMSIGAGRARLMQLVLIESVWMACLATAIGAIFAWWAAPFVVSLINPPADPARLALPLDWRVLAFSLALTVTVAALFGLAPALRASSVEPIGALKGGDDPHARRGIMQALVALQVAFCVFVLFVTGLFVTTFERLSEQPNGFSAERIVSLDVAAKPAQPPAFWNQVADRLRAQPGVEAVAISGWPLLDGNAWNSYITVNGEPPSNVMAFFLNVTPGWTDVMKIPLVAGRQFTESDAFPNVAIVNEAFARAFFNGENPVGKSFARTVAPQRTQIVGLVRDARYRDVRGPILPVAYVPFVAIQAGDARTPRPQGAASLIVRTANADPLSLAPMLRQAVPAARPEFRVGNIRTQVEINRSHTVRERLLAMLASFFAAVALLLAAVGLYGVLHYSVLQRRREIGIRLAIGAQAADIARRVTLRVFAMVVAGAIGGVALGLGAARHLEPLFYQVHATEASMLMTPVLAMFAAALLAAVPPVLRAVRIDPIKTLRAD